MGCAFYKLVVGGCRSINAVWSVRSINSGSWRVQEYQCSMECAFYKHWLLEGAGVSMQYGVCVLSTVVVGGCRSINAVWSVHSINSGSWRVQEYQCSVGCAFYKQW